MTEIEKDIAAERWKEGVKQTLASFGASSATGAAKAAPGVAVGAGAVEVFSTSIQDLISLGTLVYIVLMIAYSLPKVCEAFRYFVALFRNLRRKNDRVVIAVDHELTEKIQSLKIQELELEIQRLREKLSKNGA